MIVDQDFVIASLVIVIKGVSRGVASNTGQVLE